MVESGVKYIDSFFVDGIPDNVKEPSAAGLVSSELALYECCASAESPPTTDASGSMGSGDKSSKK